MVRLNTSPRTKFRRLRSPRSSKSKMFESLLSVVAFECIILVLVKPLANVVSIKPQHFVNADRLPSFELTGHEIDDPLPEELGNLIVVANHSLVVTDILSQHCPLWAGDRCLFVAKVLADLNVLAALLRSKKLVNGEHIVIEPGLFGHGVSPAR